MDVTGVGILSLPIYSQIILKEVCTSVTPLLLLGISISFSMNKGKFLITKLALTHSQAFKPPCSFIPHISHSSTSGMVYCIPHRKIQIILCVSDGMSPINDCTRVMLLYI